MIYVLYLNPSAALRNSEYQGGFVPSNKYHLSIYRLTDLNGPTGLKIRR